MPHSRKMAILFSNFGPYVIARLRATEILGAKKGVEVIGLEVAGKVQRYQWRTDYGEIKHRITIIPHGYLETTSCALIIKLTKKTLANLQPDILVTSGYDSIAVLTALIWAKLHGKVSILMLESKESDQPRKAWKEWLKRRLVKRFDAAFAGGTPQKEYAISLGIPEERVFIGCDVVDNEHYARGAANVQNTTDRWRKQLGLHRPYFLNVSRFIEKKNLFRLVDAYRYYRQLTSNEPWDLVICGSGPLEDKLKNAAADLPGIHFPGFKQADELTVYYALASSFIIPSSHFEQWGLVVNEAMATGLPVLVSKACGCALDLVQEGVNGYTFDPYDIKDLARLMMKMSSGDVDLKAMGEDSRRIIDNWTPEVFAENLFKAIDACLRKKKGDLA